LYAALIGAAGILSVTTSQAQQPGQRQAGDEGHAIEAFVSEDALQASYLRNMTLDEVGTVEVAGGVFYNEDRDLIGMATALSEIGEPRENRRLVARVGPRAYAAFLSLEDQDIFSIGFGGEVRYYFDSDRDVSASITAFYAPDIMTFGNADSVTDASFRLEARLQQGTVVFVGYREFEIALPVDREVDDNLHIGFRHEF
jgi:hypothetical protein